MNVSAEPRSAARKTSPVETARPPGNRQIVLACLSLLFLGQTILLAVLTHRQISLAQYLYIHGGILVLVAVTLGATISHSSACTRQTAAAIAAVILAGTLLAGPFGAILGLCWLSGSNSRDPERGKFRRPFNISRAEVLHRLLQDGRLRISQAHATRSLIDVMLLGTRLEKLDALNVIGRRFTPHLSSALRQALEDKDAAVRVLGAKIIADRHDQYTRRIGAVQCLARETPTDPELWNRVALARLEYAESGLLDPDRASLERTSAADCLNEMNALVSQARRQEHVDGAELTHAP